MPTHYVHREGPVAAGDTRTALTTQGAVAAPGTILVPPWATKIKQLIVAVGDNTATAADGGHNFLVSLSGNGMKDGEQTVVVGGAFCDFTTAGDSGLRSHIHERLDVDMNVVPNGIVNIYAEATLGVLWGQPEFGVTLGFA